LHYRGHELEVTTEEFLVGRGSDCHLVLDDGLVSRHHAGFRWRDGALSVVDLNSRNGVRLNGTRINVPTELKDGDVVSIGPHDVRVEFGDKPSPRAKRRFNTTLSPDSRVDTAPALHSWEIPPKPSPSQRPSDAARQVAEELHRMLVTAQSGKPVDLAMGTTFALRLASETSKTLWLDWVFQVHDLSAALMTEPQVDELLLVARRLHYRGSPALRAYLDRLAARPAVVTPNDAFTVQRIHAMLKTLTA
jgi:hypothetical protein